MKKQTLFSHSQPLLVIAVAASVIAIAAAVFISQTSRNAKTTQTAKNTTVQLASNGDSYVDNRFHFSVKHLPGMNYAEQLTNGISVSGGKEDQWGMSVVVTSTNLLSTNTWLTQQPKGSVTHQGVKFLRWIDAGPRRLALYSRFVQIDTDGQKPIYGQYLEAAHIADGKLYRILDSQQFKGTEQPKIDQDFLTFVQSFRITTSPST